MISPAWPATSEEAVNSNKVTKRAKVNIERRVQMINCLVSVRMKMGIHKKEVVCISEQGLKFSKTQKKKLGVVCS